MTIVSAGERRVDLRWIALLVAAGIALYVCWLMLQPFVKVLAWAAVLVIIFSPVHQRLVAWLRRPGWSAMLSTALVIVVILAPVTLITIAVVNELTALVQNLQGSLATLLGPHSPIIGRLTGWLSQYIDVSRLHPQEYLAQRLNSLSANLAGRTLGLVGGLVGGVIEVFFIIFTMYYLFRDSARIRRALCDVIPLEREQSEQIFERTREVIYASVYGVLVIAGIQGLLGGLAFGVLGLPSALVWGVVMFLLSMIPMAGSFLVWIPAAAYLALTGHPGRALILVIWGLVVIGTIDNLLRPRLVGRKTRLHELLIFFSVLGGLQLFGVIGLVLGPVIVAVTLALLDIFRQVDRSFSFARHEER